MSARAKRIFKKVISWSGIFFFILAVGMLYWQLHNYSLMDIARALWSIPFLNLAYACLACLAGYICLSVYDYLALRYVGKKVSVWKWMLAGVLGFAISNNAGHAVVSGGAIRYRLYTRWRIRGGEIVKMLVFSGFTYFLGCTAIMILGYLMVPHSLFEQSMGAKIGIHGLFIFCLAALLAYFSLTIFFPKKSIKLGEIRFQVPTAQMALGQMGLGMMDSILASLVLYFCLIPFVQIPFGTFVGLFVIAQTAGVFSQVPGGIGVFESIFLLALPDDISKASIFGALLAYRIIYYVLPLIGAGGLFFIYERWLKARMKRWMEEANMKRWLEETAAKAKQHLPHLPKFPKRKARTVNTAKAVRKARKSDKK
ncbi:MAG: lysylphosphatidylglycerol synthase domain-containing protein [Rickettsiales bacterium]|jgi:phosphatidylglycerol lysyltransferase|nr:lysylphosphatidylglycerol synthase domain-containing protein [Rickettsiales bacterium]